MSENQDTLEQVLSFIKETDVSVSIRYDKHESAFIFVVEDWECNHKAGYAFSEMMMNRRMFPSFGALVFQWLESVRKMLKLDLPIFERKLHYMQEEVCPDERVSALLGTPQKLLSDWLRWVDTDSSTRESD